MPQESIRTFIAIEIDEKIKEKIVEIQEQIRQSNCLKGKWVIKNNLHLTLKFLGDTKLKYVDKIKDRITECVKNETPINCILNQIGVFPDEKFARVLWVGLEDRNARILNLVKKIEESLFLLGFKKEKKDFKSHITICRPKQIINKNQFKIIFEEINKNFQPQEVTINKITFFESKLTPQGPIYSALSGYNI